MKTTANEIKEKWNRFSKLDYKKRAQKSKEIFLLSIKYVLMIDIRFSYEGEINIFIWTCSIGVWNNFIKGIDKEEQSYSYLEKINPNLPAPTASFTS